MDRLRVFSFLFLLLPAFGSSAQSRKIDSLRKLLPTIKEDSDRVITLNAFGWEFRNLKSDTAILLSTQALELARKLGYGTGIGKSLHNLGVYYYRKGDYKKAIAFDQSALTTWDSLGKADSLRTYFFENAAALTLGNLANVLKEQGFFPRALEKYFQTLNLSEKHKDFTLQSNILGSIGSLYQETGQFDKAIDFYFKGLHISDSIGNKVQSAILLGNIGVVYWNKKEFTQALEFDTRALKLDEALKNKYGVGRHLGNLGLVYKDMNDFKKALEHYQKAIVIHTELGNKRGLALVLGNLGDLYRENQRYTEARTFLERSLKLSTEIGLYNVTRSNYEQLSQLYEAQGQWSDALLYYKKYIVARDSIFNEENTKKQTQSEMQFIFDKQQAADSIRNTEQMKQEELRHGQEIRQQQIYTYGGVAGFLLMLVVAGVSFNAYRTKQKANEIISEQKLLVEMKQKEIIDSIHYAKRIQQSLLPSDRYVAKCLEKAGKTNV
jgi:adenylate cyclase